MNGVAAILYSSHQMLAAMSGIPEFGIKQVQAEVLGGAIANVARHYDTNIDQKNLDWFNLFQVVALVYGPVIGKIAGNAKEKRRARGNAQPQADTNTGGGFSQPGFVDAPVQIDMSNYQ